MEPDWLNPILNVAAGALELQFPALLGIALASVRFLGLLTASPLSGSQLVPLRLRIGLALLLGVAAAPVASATSIDLAGPALIGAVVSEFLIGAALGFGVRIVLAGLDHAAVLIEQQCGFASTEQSHPLGGDATTPTGQGLALLGITVLLTLSPLGGEAQLVRGLLESLRSLPPGTPLQMLGPAQLVHDLAAVSLLLGLQVAAPLVVVLGLLQAAWSMLARTRGAVHWQATFTPVRLLLGLLLLATTLGGMGERVGATLEGCLTVSPTRVVSGSSTHGESP